MRPAFWFRSGCWLACCSDCAAAGAHLGWGFQFQSPVFLSLMAALLFLPGLSLAGQFEIGLTLTSAGGIAGREAGLHRQLLHRRARSHCRHAVHCAVHGRGHWLRAGADRVVTFAVFTALALGLAAPYVALTLQPAWTRILPRPGAWMEILKQAVSVPIFGTVIWLAWVLA